MLILLKNQGDKSNPPIQSIRLILPMPRGYELILYLSPIYGEPQGDMCSPCTS